MSLEDDFLQFLATERNASPRTLRNYRAALAEFRDWRGEAFRGDPRNQPPAQQVEPARSVVAVLGRRLLVRPFPHPVGVELRNHELSPSGSTGTRSCRQNQ